MAVKKLNFLAELVMLRICCLQRLLVAVNWFLLICRRLHWPVVSQLVFLSRQHIIVEELGELDSYLKLRICSNFSDKSVIFCADFRYDYDEQFLFYKDSCNQLTHDGILPIL